MKKLKFMVESTNGSIRKGQGNLTNIKNYLTKEFDNIKSFKIMSESIYSPRILDNAWRELKRRARKDKFISTEALENVSRDFAEDPETRVVSRSLSDRLYDELIEKMDAEGYELMSEDEYNDKFDSPKWQPDTLKYYYAKKKAVNESEKPLDYKTRIALDNNEIRAEKEFLKDLIKREGIENLSKKMIKRCEKLHLLPKEKKAVNESKNLNEGYNDLTVGELKDILQGALSDLKGYEDNDIVKVEYDTYDCSPRFISLGTKGFVDLDDIDIKFDDEE